MSVLLLLANLRPWSSNVALTQRAAIVDAALLQHPGQDAHAGQYLVMPAR